MTNFSANFLTNCSFGEQFANLNELYIWYARTEQLWSLPRYKQRFKYGCFVDLQPRATNELYSESPDVATVAAEQEINVVADAAVSRGKIEDVCYCYSSF